MLKVMHVLYDDSCGLCRACTEWLKRQPKYVALEFHAAQAPGTARRFRGLASAAPKELIVVDDGGFVYRHENAWLMLLWALKEYRGLADTLSSPELKPFAKKIITLVSSNRHRISRWMGACCVDTTAPAA